MVSRSVEVDLSFPYISTRNRYTEIVGERSIRWGREHGMLDDVEAAWLTQGGAHRLAGYVNPALDEDGLQLACDWYLWLYAFDDTYLDETESGDRLDTVVYATLELHRILEKPDAKATAHGHLADALRDLRSRVGARGSASQLQRWIVGVHEYLSGVVWECERRHNRRVAELDDYIAIRATSGGVRSAFELFDVTAGYEAPEAEMASPKIRDMARAAGNIICWDNDFYSYGREASGSQVISNLLGTLQHHQEISLGQAVSVAKRLRDAEVANFLAVEAAVRDAVSDETRRWIDQTKAWIAGHLTYCVDSARFHAQQDAERDVVR